MKGRAKRARHDDVSPSPVSPEQLAAQRAAAIRGAYADLGDTVYFVRRAGLIKIGHSSRLRTRLAALEVRSTDLLFLMPGGREVEHDMHTRFAHLRARGDGLGREHFHPGPDLLEFINDRREAMGLTTLAA